MKRYLRRLNVFLCLLTAFSSLFISPALADEKAKRVLILPLTIHSEKDLTFLNQGIMDIMAARIGEMTGKLQQTHRYPQKMDPSANKYLKICTQDPIALCINFIATDDGPSQHHMLDCRCSLDNCINGQRKRG